MPDSTAHFAPQTLTLPQIAEHVISAFHSPASGSGDSTTKLGAVDPDRWRKVWGVLPAGLPGRRYYGGCEHVDAAEQLAIDRVKRLFGAAWANVQPHSGAQANAAVMLAFLHPGDTILGFDLSHGGHLTLRRLPGTFGGAAGLPFRGRDSGRWRGSRRSGDEALRAASRAR